MTGRALVLLIGIVSSGLIGGLFFGWAVSVIPGTKRTSDDAYVETMRAINSAIVNPSFVIPFMVTPLVLLGAGVLQWRAGETRRAWVGFVAAGTYLIGVLGVTFGGNIPLNNALEAFDPAGATAAELGQQRHDYEGPWNRWHNVRTVASVVAFALAGAAAIISEESA